MSTATATEKPKKSATQSKAEPPASPVDGRSMREKELEYVLGKLIAISIVSRELVERILAEGRQAKKF
jgi:hypothetical protein